MAKKLGEDEILALCQAQMRGALGFLQGKLAQSRLKALRFYNAEPYGNEVDGSSQIVTTEVRDTIESAMPSLMKVFMSGDKVAQFDPTGPEDEAVADQATDYANYIFTKDNDGFGILQTAFRDGLIQKQGVVKIFWEEIEDHKRETYRGLSDSEMEQLLAPDEVEVLAHSAEEGALAQIDPATGLETVTAATLHDLVVRRKKTTGRVRIVNVPPEEFLISRRATSLADASFVAHRVKKTASQLIEQGYSREARRGSAGRRRPAVQRGAHRALPGGGRGAGDEWRHPRPVHEGDLGHRMLSAHRCRRRRHRRAAQDHHRRRPGDEAAGQRGRSTACPSGPGRRSPSRTNSSACRWPT